MLISAISSAQLISITKTMVSCENAKDSDTLLVYSMSNSTSSSPILGNYERIGSKMIFRPLIPFQAEKKYFAQCGAIDTIFEISLADDYQYAKVLGLYPSIMEVPSNLLKFYIKFDRPMAINAYPYIDLLDNSGQKMDRALLKEIPELWNDERTLLCVWFEPGRIKRGLGPNERLGPVLKPDNQYTILISDQLRDSNGVKIGSGQRHQILSTKEDRMIPQFDEWEVSVSNDKMRVKIDFKESLDFSSSIDAFQIKGLNGDWELSNSQSSISFNSKNKLKSGTYRISVNPKIEDLAGNNLRRLFDHNKVEESVSNQEKFELKFTVEN